ncbi:MAG: tRNA (adenosine(37)-N6)-dimethylallyltransferase MiaA [Pseudomonadota bacterium]
MIAGPTASGKTLAGLDLARILKEEKGARPAEIVNADAIQVYGDIPILSSQPTDEERDSIPHHLFGYLSGATRCSAGGWYKDAATVLKDIAFRRSTAIVVGGTGLYFRALLGQLSDIPDIPSEIAAEARSHLEDVGLPQFRQNLLTVDPEMARLDPNDRQRHLRAWSVYKATGRPLSSFQTASAGSAQEVDAKVVIEPDREELYRRCDDRFDKMLALGAIDEAKRLIREGYARDMPVMKAVGVAELVSYLDGDISLDDAITLAKRNTRRLAKRQLTWFRNQTADWPRAASSRAATEVLRQALRDQSNSV